MDKIPTDELIRDLAQFEDRIAVLERMTPEERAAIVEDAPLNDVDAELTGLRGRNARHRAGAAGARHRPDPGGCRVPRRHSGQRVTRALFGLVALLLVSASQARRDLDGSGCRDYRW